MNELELFDFTEFTLPGIPVTTGVLASGPFIVEHNDSSFIGLMLSEEDEGLSMLDTRHEIVMPLERFEIDGKKIVGTQDEDRYIIRSLRASDISNHMSVLTDVSLLEARAVYFRKYFQDEGIKVAVPEFAVTAADDETVISMFMIDAADVMHRRVGGSWERLDASAEDEPDLEDLTWITVRSSAIDLFDTLENDDVISVHDFEEYRA